MSDSTQKTYTVAVPVIGYYHYFVAANSADDALERYRVDHDNRAFVSTDEAEHGSVIAAIDGVSLDA